ncbi:MAG: response regulator transcription factor [Deltaproteobacteria bacterium]|nr:response regulator transcription factor [Deltaproteobacteria bacterium]
MNTRIRTRVLVADDNRLTRLGIVTVLELHDDLEVVGQAADGAQAVTMWRELKPDVLVVDLKMPHLDGVQVTTQLCKDDQNARILVLTHYDGDENIFQALRAGARGYLTKDIEGNELVEAIRALAAGGRFIPPEIASRVADRANRPELTPREQQVLERMAVGLTNKEIAQELDISDRTIGVYVGNILSKLEAKTRTEAVTVARKRGLLQPA